MAEPARRPDAAEEPPVPDPIAVRRAYRFHKTRRRIRQERKQERALARLRFFAILLSLLVLAAYLSLVVWRQIEQASPASTGASRILPAVESPETYPQETYEPEESADRFGAGRGLGGGRRAADLARRDGARARP